MAAILLSLTVSLVAVGITRAPTSLPSENSTASLSKT